MNQSFYLKHPKTPKPKPSSPWVDMAKQKPKEKK